MSKSGVFQMNLQKIKLIYSCQNDFLRWSYRFMIISDSLLGKLSPASLKALESKSAAKCIIKWHQHLYALFWKVALLIYSMKWHFQYLRESNILHSSKVVNSTPSDELNNPITQEISRILFDGSFPNGVLEKISGMILNIIYISQNISYICETCLH